MKQNISIKTYLQKFFKNLYLIFLYRPFIDKKSSARGVNICLQVSLWVLVLAYFVIFIQDVPKPLSELKTFYGKIGKMCGMILPLVGYLCNKWIKCAYPLMCKVRNFAAVKIHFLTNLTINVS